jgi:hypothetical protein
MDIGLVGRKAPINDVREGGGESAYQKEKKKKKKKRKKKHSPLNLLKNDPSLRPLISHSDLPKCREVITKSRPHDFCDRIFCGRQPCQCVEWAVNDVFQFLVCLFFDSSIPLIPTQTDRHGIRSIGGAARCCPKAPTYHCTWGVLSQCVNYFPIFLEEKSPLTLALTHTLSLSLCAPNP